MLFPEEKKVYETKIGKTKYVITSESLPDTRRDILDSLTCLMVRDCGSLYDPSVETPQNQPPIDTERAKSVLKERHIIWDGIHEKPPEK